MKILIIQTKMGIGDMIIYLPYIHAISKKYKKSVFILKKRINFEEIMSSGVMVNVASA